MGSGVALGSHDQVRQVLGSITCPGVAFALEAIGSTVAILEVVATGRHERRGRPWLIPTTAREAEIVRTAFLAVLEFEAEQVREAFRVDGAPIFGDLDVGGLVELARRTAAFNEAVEHAKRQLRRQGVAR